MTAFDRATKLANALNAYTGEDYYNDVAYGEADREAGHGSTEVYGFDGEDGEVEAVVVFGAGEWVVLLTDDPNGRAVSFDASVVDWQ